MERVWSVGVGLGFGGLREVRSEEMFLGDCCGLGMDGWV